MPPGVAGGLAAARGLVGVDDHFGVVRQQRPQFLQVRRPPPRAPVARLQLLLRAQAVPQEPRLLRPVQLGQGDGVDAAAHHQQPPAEGRAGDQAAIPDAQQAGKDGPEPGAARQDADLARLGQHPAGGLQVLHPLGVVDQDAPLAALGALAGGGGVYRQPALAGDEFPYLRVPHRFKGVTPKDALRYRDPVDIVYPAGGGAADLGKGRDKGKLFLPAGPHHRFQLGADIPPQGGIGLFIDVGDAQPDGLAGDAGHHLKGPLRRQMAGLGVHHQHLRPVAALPQIGGGTGDHPCFRPGGGQLDAGIQGAGKIVGDHQDLDHSTPPFPLVPRLFFYFRHHLPLVQCKEKGVIVQNFITWSVFCLESHQDSFIMKHTPF